MCFSATASFVAGVSLSVIGVATVRKTKQKVELPFAMIPLLFGMQQIIEGLLWLSFRYDAHLLNVTTTYIFTLFSHVLWPIFVPFAIGLMESTTWRKKVISLFLIMGIAVGLYNFYFIVKYPVIAKINCNMVYVSPHFHKLQVMALYLLSTGASCFFSSHKIINILGVLSLLLFMVAYWFYTVAFFSVWCFFAAILSIIIYLHFNIKKPHTGVDSSPSVSHST